MARHRGTAIGCRMLPNRVCSPCPDELTAVLPHVVESHAVSWHRRLGHDTDMRRRRQQEMDGFLQISLWIGA